MGRDRAAGDSSAPGRAPAANPPESPRSPAAEAGTSQHRAKASRLRTRRGAELVLLALALVAASLLAFAGPAGSASNAYPVHYLVVPFVAWGAVRFGPRGSAVAVLVTACIAVRWSG